MGIARGLSLSARVVAAIIPIGGGIFRVLGGCAQIRSASAQIRSSRQAGYRRELSRRAGGGEATAAATARAVAAVAARSTRRAVRGHTTECLGRVGSGGSVAPRAGVGAH